VSSIAATQKMQKMGGGKKNEEKKMKKKKKKKKAISLARVRSSREIIIDGEK
jgi:hypothetical protein